MAWDVLPRSARRAASPPPGPPKAAGATRLRVVRSEADLQGNVLKLAAALGWRSVHFRAAVERSGKWATPVQGPHGRGFPDCVLVRGERLIFVELKSSTGELRPEQREWLKALTVVPGVETYVIRPEDFEKLAKILRGA